MNRATVIACSTGVTVLAACINLVGDVGAGIDMKVIDKTSSSIKPIVRVLGIIGGFSVPVIVGAALTGAVSWCAVSALNGSYHLVEEIESCKKE